MRGTFSLVFLCEFVWFCREGACSFPLVVLQRRVERQDQGPALHTHNKWYRRGDHRSPEIKATAANAVMRHATIAWFSVYGSQLYLFTRL